MPVRAPVTSPYSVLRVTDGSTIGGGSATDGDTGRDDENLPTPIAKDHALSQISLLKQAGEVVVPGSVVRRNGVAMVVMCGDGPLRIVEWVSEVSVSTP